MPFHNPAVLAECRAAVFPQHDGQPSSCSALDADTAMVDLALLQDEALAGFAEQLLSGSWCAIMPGLPGQPLAAVSPAFEQLAGQPAADLRGSSSSQMQQAFRLEPQV
jgi:hypothetical protein